MKMLKFNMINGTQIEEGSGEDDGPDAVISETTQPVMITVDQVRSFSPRKGTRVGTRIVFRNSSAIPVKETFEEVAAAFEAVQS